MYESSHVEVSVFTREAINRKTFRRLTTEKATLARKADSVHRNSHGSKKMFRFRFLGKEKPKNTHCVSAIA